MWTRSSGWVAVALLCKMLVPAPGIGKVRVIPASHQGALDACMDAQLQQLLLQLHPQDPLEAYKAFARAVVLEPVGRPPTRVAFREEGPAEFPGVVAVVVVGDTIEKATIFTLDGDGAFSGPGSVFRLCGGSVAIFQGTPSTQSPLTLQLFAEWQECSKRLLRDCLERCKKALSDGLDQCAVPTPECLQALVDQYNQCAAQCERTFCF